MKASNTVIITNTSVFAALTIVLTFANTEVPFPLLPYLKFDLAEIPVMILLFLMGPVPALASEVVGWIALSVARGWVLGPTMKFLAVTPMILGYWIGVRTFKRLFHRKKLGPTFIFGTVIGAIVRIAATSIMNIVTLLLIAPDFLKFAESMLRLVGLTSSSAQVVLTWTILLTALFNTLQAFISAVPAAITVRGAAFKIPWVTQNAWILGCEK